MLRAFTAATVVLLILTLAPCRSGAAQDAFDHSAWDRLLKQHVNNGMVDYDAFGRAPEFAAYLESLARF